MKPSIKIVLWIIALLLAIVIVFWFSIRVPNKVEPERLSNIPETAVWKGGVDRGFWYEIVNIDSVNRIVRLKVYADYNGELVIDADYSEKQGCEILPFTKEKIRENIFDYAFNDIYLLKNNCSLIMIEPAYGGTFLEIDKEQSE